MSSTWVLLTALPPTRGHLQLVRFAEALDRGDGGDGVTVLVCTQPDEPFVAERPAAVAAAIDGALRDRVEVLHFAEQVQQVPDGDDDAAFWAMWVDILAARGLRPGDTIVASEPYGVPLAGAAGCRFVPYDPGRVTDGCNATSVRRDPLSHFDVMVPEFARLLTRRVTFFGAESTGKTTLSVAVAEQVSGHLLPEWARPYLDLIGPVVTDDAMHTIWSAQRALQESIVRHAPRPFIVQDTDLFSTLGYWEMFDPAGVPPGLADDAVATRSDLYVMCPSDIPFEPDPQRFGGDRRESTDQYWIDLLERFGLNYVVLGSSDPDERLRQATEAVLGTFDQRILAYDRIT